MSITNITCPSCNYSKDVLTVKLPSSAAKITCPQCKQGFDYHPAHSDADFEFDTEERSRVHVSHSDNCVSYSDAPSEQDAGVKLAESPIHHSSNSAVMSNIEEMPVSDKWKNVFRTFAAQKISRVDIFGCPKYASDDVRLKSKGIAIYKKENVICNWWAFCFGPYWYLSKRMWKKGMLLICLSIVIEIICASISPTLNGPALMATGAIALFAANYDYYRTRVLNESFWW